MAQLELFLFGSPRIRLDGREVEIRLHKAIAFLAYLVVTKRAHSREALATLFWPDADQTTALGRLRRTLYRVRQAVGSDVVLASRTMAELNPEADVWLDVDRFQQLLAGCVSDSRPGSAPDAACVARLVEAVELYADDLMAGFALADSPPFDEWQFFEAEGLRRALDQALEQLMDIYQAQGAWEEATRYARRRLALDPLEERAHRRLMQLYALAGRQAAALRQYAECERILKSELGMAPGEETVALRDAIRSREMAAKRGSLNVPARGHEGGTPVADEVLGSGGHAEPGSGLGALSDNGRSPPGHTGLEDRSDPIRLPDRLPAAMHPLVGRERELEEIHTLLAQDPHCRLLVIVGPGGIGKTPLALEVARRAEHLFGDGVHYIRLGPRSAANQLLPALAEGVGLRPLARTALDEQLVRYLRGKRLLLVLDGFENLVDGAGLLAELLKGAPDLKILVTSHERLNLSGETVYTLDGMPFPSNGSCQNALDHSCVQLLIHLGRLARPHLELGPEDICQASRICRMVEGTPPALVLAAGWLEMLSFRERGQMS